MKLLTILDKVDAFSLGHAFSEVSVTVTIDVGTARPWGGRDGEEDIQRSTRHTLVQISSPWQPIGVGLTSNGVGLS